MRAEVRFCDGTVMDMETEDPPMKTFLTTGPYGNMVDVYFVKIDGNTAHYMEEKTESSFKSDVRPLTQEENAAFEPLISTGRVVSREQDEELKRFLKDDEMTRIGLDGSKQKFAHPFDREFLGDEQC